MWTSLEDAAHGTEEPVSFHLLPAGGGWLQPLLGYSWAVGGMGRGLSLFRVSPANSEYANRNPL